MKQTYRTLNSSATAELVEKKSRFIGHCAPVETEEAALEFITQIRAQHRTASHNVYAYSLRDNNLCRYSDDGEPQGTAGLPVLDILTRGGITDAVIVVTRYFGGTLLGTGGLVRAYSETASLAVKEAGIAVMEMCSVYEITCDYPLYDRLQKTLELLEASIVNSAFTDVVTLEAAILSAGAAKLIDDVSELTRGQCIPKHLYDNFQCVRVE